MSDALIADRYRLVRAIGRGAVGEVWLGDDLVLSRQVAIKRLTVNPSAGFDSDAIERIVREARVAARLHHPHVVSVFDLVTDAGAPYVVMEYVDGESLEARLRRSGPLPAAEARDVIGQIADALAAAHSRGIVHRDVKPANIMIDGSGVAKLADFGIARGEGDAALTMTGQTVGTIAYLAPEVARGGAASAASDVWSLGVTLHAAIQGRSPYDDGRSQSAIGMLMRIASEPLPAVPNGPMRSVITEMLAADPHDRPSARDVARSLGVATRPAPTTVPSPSAAALPAADVARRGAEITLDRPSSRRNARSGRHTSPAGRRRPGRLVLAAAGVLVVAAAGTAAAVLLNGDNTNGTSAPIDYTAAQLALTGDGASGAYAAGSQDEILGAAGGIAVLDSTTGRAIRFIPVDAQSTVTQVLLDRTGDLAYVTEIDSTVDAFHENGQSRGRLVEIRLSTRQAVKSLSLCGDPVPRGMVLSPADDRLLIAMDSCNEVVDPTTMTEIGSRASPGVGSAPPPTIAIDGSYGYVAEASGLIVQVSLASGAFAGTDSEYRGVRGIAASPNGKYLYLYSPYGLLGDPAQRGELVPYDIAAKQATHGAITLGYGAYAVATSPGGRYVVAAASGYDSSGHALAQGSVTVIDTRDFAYYPVTVPGGRGSIAFTADGQSVFVANSAGAVSKIDLATHTVVAQAHGGGGWLFRSADPNVIYATDGRASGVAIDVGTGTVLRPVSLSG